MATDAPHAGLDLRVPSPMVEVIDERLAAHGVRMWLKRDDLIHPDLPGNKWRKLKYNLVAATEQGHRTLLTFGGAYSNHIRAVAAAGRLLGFDTIGIIRGEEHLPLNPTLEYATASGMRLSYMDRTTYRSKHKPEVLGELRRKWGEFYLLPEGGSNELAVKGCAELPSEIDVDYDVVCCSCGTGGTLAGIAAGLPAAKQALGFSALKGGDFLTTDVARLQQQTNGATSDNWSIECGFHFGGFARKSAALEEFISDFHHRHGVTLEWVYVAKMMFGLYTLVNQGRFLAGSRIVAVITG